MRRILKDCHEQGRRVSPENVTVAIISMVGKLGSRICPGPGQDGHHNRRERGQKHRDGGTSRGNWKGMKMLRDIRCWGISFIRKAAPASWGIQSIREWVQETQDIETEVKPQASHCLLRDVETDVALLIFRTTGRITEWPTAGTVRNPTKRDYLCSHLKDDACGDKMGLKSSENPAPPGTRRR